MTLCADGRFWIYKNSIACGNTKRKEKPRESLNKEPFELKVKGLGELTLGWDLENDRFMHKLNGVAYEDLEKDENGPKEPELIMNNSKIILNGKHMEMKENQWSP